MNDIAQISLERKGESDVHQWSISIGNHRCDMGYMDENGVIDFESEFDDDCLDILSKICVTDIPDNISIHFFTNNRSFNCITVKKIKGQLFFVPYFNNDVLTFFSDELSLKYIFRKIQEIFIPTDNLIINEVIEEWDGTGVIIFEYYPQNEHLYIAKDLDIIDKQLECLITTTQLALKKFNWLKDYETDEMLFINDIILNLLRKMDFLSVSFNHGRKEFGKDVTFSELDRFGQLKHYGVQVKAGNISGKVRSQIDEIIAQIEDSFIMPYYEIGSKEPRFISTMLVIISGFFTENAKDKIAEKIPKGTIGSVYFIDKNKVFELCERYWK